LSNNSRAIFRPAEDCLALNHPGFSRDKMIGEEDMKNQISYSLEVRERALRLVFEQQKEHESQFAIRNA
jgi:hypothetical protein